MSAERQKASADSNPSYNELFPLSLGDQSRTEFHAKQSFFSSLLGTVADGLAQNLSFIVGLKALLVLAASIYGIAMLLQATGKVAQTQIASE